MRDIAEARDIPGFPGYAVTRDGHVWSHPKRMRGSHGSVRSRSGKWLKPRLASMGYYTVNIRREGKLYRLYIHRAVAVAWVPNPQPDLFDQVNHINGVKTDNCPENLEWCDQSRNNEHAYRIGLMKGARTLSDEQAAEVKRLRSCGTQFKVLEAQFGLSRGSLAQICQGKTYRSRETPNV